MFSFISSDGHRADFLHIATKTRVHLYTLENRFRGPADLLADFNAWRMEKHIGDIGTMQANAARYGYEDPAQIARDYQPPRPATT